MNLNLTVGDTGPNLTFRLNADLTGATATAHIRRPDKTVLTRPVAIDNPTEGTGHITWQVGDLAEQGIHKVEVQVTYSDTTVQTFAVDDSGMTSSFYLRDQIA